MRVISLEAIDDLWATSGFDRATPLWVDVEEGRRCRQCCRLYSRGQDLKAHHTRGCEWAVASRIGTKAEKTIRQGKQAAAVKLGEKELKAAFTFKYRYSKYT
jgi:hypothetical protein